LVEHQMQALPLTMMRIVAAVLMMLMIEVAWERTGIKRRRHQQQQCSLRWAALTAAAAAAAAAAGQRSQCTAYTTQSTNCSDAPAQQSEGLPQ
jgi:steroid 5-alpha reductase family enzyme